MSKQARAGDVRSGGQHKGRLDSVGQSARPQHAKAVAPSESSAWYTAKSIAWSFFGVRRRLDHEHASARINPIHVIVAGFIGIFVLVVGLMVLVRWVAG